MGYGAVVDAVIGRASRLLHLRSTDTDTSGDLHRYLDVPIDELLPAPPGVPTVERRAPPLPLVSRIVETVSWKSAHVPLSERYRARHEGEYRKNLTAYARWMHKRGLRRRSILVYVHGWLEPGSWVEESTLLPLWYRALQVDVAHVQLPFHGRRSPSGQLFHGEWFWTADLVRSLEGVRQAVMDVRSIVAWFRSIGYEEVGVTGLSLGGCITMLLACVEPMPDYVVPMISHLELTDAIEEAPILWRMKSDLERFGISSEKRREIFSRLSLSSSRPRLENERQLWVAAREDGYLKPSLVEKQWEHWGRPPILWVPGGHMTFPVGVKAATERMRGLVQRAGRQRFPTPT